jgi:hypothetical protein
VNVSKPSKIVLDTFPVPDAVVHSGSKLCTLPTDAILSVPPFCIIGAFVAVGCGTAVAVAAGGLGVAVAVGCGTAVAVGCGTAVAVGCGTAVAVAAGGLGVAVAVGSAASPHAAVRAASPTAAGNRYLRYLFKIHLPAQVPP